MLMAFAAVACFTPGVQNRHLQYRPPLRSSQSQQRTCCMVQDYTTMSYEALQAEARREGLDVNQYPGDLIAALQAMHAPEASTRDVAPDVAPKTMDAESAAKARWLEGQRGTAPSPPQWVPPVVGSMPTDVAAAEEMAAAQIAAETAAAEAAEAAAAAAEMEAVSAAAQAAAAAAMAVAATAAAQEAAAAENNAAFLSDVQPPESPPTAAKRVPVDNVPAAPPAGQSPLPVPPKADDGPVTGKSMQSPEALVAIAGLALLQLFCFLLSASMIYYDLLPSTPTPK